MRTTDLLEAFANIDAKYITEACRNICDNSEEDTCCDAVSNTGKVEIMDNRKTLYRKIASIAVIAVSQMVLIGMILFLISRNNPLGSEHFAPLDNEQTSSASDIVNSDDNAEFSFCANMNVLCENNQNSLLEANQATVQCDSENVKLRLIVCAEPDPSLNWDTVPLDIYVFNEGQLISHLSQDTSEQYQVSRYTVTPFEETSIDISIPMSQLSGNGEALINIVANFAPEHIAQRHEEYPGLREFSGIVSTYTIIQSDLISTKKIHQASAQTTDYVEANVLESVFDVGYEYGYERDKVASNHMNEDIAIDNHDRKLYIKASLGKECKSDYYVGIFCNGKLLDKFDGEYLMKVNTNEGKQILNYCVNDNWVLSENAVYSFQAIFLPTYEAVTEGCTNSYSTYKHRIMVES